MARFKDPLGSAWVLVAMMLLFGLCIALVVT
jgi:hypothetical protein